VEGKTVSDTGIAGQITQIGESIAEVFLTRKVEAHTNLRIVHSEQEESRFSELYAKVLPKEEHSAKLPDESVLIKFTTLPHEIEKFFAKAEHK
jgi:hypothetical protein